MPAQSSTVDLPNDAFVATLTSAATSPTALLRGLSEDSDLAGCRFVVRGQTIGIFGTWDSRIQQRLDALRSQLRYQLPYMTVLDFDQVQELCRQLAIRLRPALPSDVVIVPVPRGGMVVAGLLAYELGVPREMVRPPHDDEPVLLVDDSIISGFRISEAIDQQNASQIIIGVLASTAAATDYLSERFGELISVISAVKLRDHAGEILGDDVASWRERWMSRDAEGAAVLPDHLVYPWSEPDWTFWNTETNDEDRGFRLHRNHHGSERGSAQPEVIAGEFPGAADGVVWATFGDSIVIAKEESEQTTSFTVDGFNRLAFDKIARSNDTDEFESSFASELRTHGLIR